MKLFNLMVNVFKLDGIFYELWCSQDNILIHRRLNTFLPDIPVVQPEYLSHFFQFIKDEILRSRKLFTLDIESDFYYLDKYIIGFEEDSIGISKNAIFKNGYYFNLKKEVKNDLIQRLDEF